MEEKDKGYLAGLIDGEGSILLQNNHKGEFRSPAVSISTTTPEIIDFVSNYYKVNTIQKKSLNKNYLPETVITIRTDEAIRLLEDILPYMRHAKKIKRGRHIVDNYKNVTVRNGKYNPAQLEAKLQFEKEFFEL